jgi:transposase
MEQGRSRFPGTVGDRGRTAADNRWFLEAVLWIGRTGSPWRDLPTEFGQWHTVYMRFSRWQRKGVRQRVAHAMAGETEIEYVLIGSTIVRAHQHRVGATKKRCAGAWTFARRTEYQTASGCG